MYSCASYIRKIKPIKFHYLSSNGLWLWMTTTIDSTSQSDSTVKTPLVENISGVFCFETTRNTCMSRVTDTQWTAWEGTGGGSTPRRSCKSSQPPVNRPWMEPTDSWGPTCSNWRRTMTRCVFRHFQRFLFWCEILHCLFSRSNFKL